ncbi:MAG TPA: choice-of-anchor D domain-containing protein [Pseudolabrys sp.]|nr:choice-of-anchor D domain-containing protein [Pseudolabrys sp.]
MSPVPGAPSAQTSRATSKFEFMFSPPAKWPGALVWYYNHAGAPVQFSDAKEAVIQQIVAQSAKWTAACGIQIEYGGETEAVPKTLAEGPGGISVVGWGKPDMTGIEGNATGATGATYVWYQSYAPNVLTLVESDMMLDPTYVTTFDQMMRTVSHEWGHAIGLAHSNVDGALMSGPPDSMYTNGADLTPDDIHGCRCLYGPPAGQGAGNLCSLPDVIKFGVIPVGSTSSESQVTVTNSGNAALVMSDIQADSGEFPEFVVGTNGCPAGYPLAPGASCTFGVVAQPAQAGDRIGEVTINTSEGPYRIPLEATGGGAQLLPAPNFEGLWWNAPAGSESGWGINVAHQGDVIFATWFTYDLTGKGMWLVMTAPQTAPNTYAGTLYSTTGPAFNAVPFNPSQVVATAVGNGTLTFTDASNGSFSYTVNGISQNKAITREVFGTLPSCAPATSSASLAAATNYQDLWWAAPAGSESGWGINLNHQSDTIFATWFTYDLDGSPMWLVVTARKTAPGVYSGTLYRTSGPAFNSAPFNPANVVATAVGNATFTFADGNNANFAYAVNGIAQQKAITREVFTAPGTVCQ